LRWHLPLYFNLLQPGLLGGLHRALSDRELEQWSAFSKGKLIGVLSWQSSSLEADRLWLAVGASKEDEAIEALSLVANSDLRPGRKLALNYPAGRGADALNAAGFTAARTLIWMQYPWRN
jgi:predicted Zn-ribbon and HTH transcriptional regulator